MALEKQSSIDKIEIVGNGIIQIREITRILENGKEISFSYHRWALNPNDNLNGQEDKVKSIANATWTPEVIAAYNAQQEANKLGTA